MVQQMPQIPSPPAVPDTGSAQVSDVSYTPPKRWALVDGQWKWDAHQGVVSANGTIRDYYKEGEETQIWYSMSDAKKTLITSIFKDKGLSVSSPMSTINSFGSLLYQANVLGESWETTLNRLQKLPSYRTSTGPSYRVTNPADLRAVAKAVFRETLGRAATEEETTRFISSYQQSQRAGTGTVAAPSVEVAAQDFARISAPKEAAAYEMLNYIGQFANAAQNVGR